MFYEGKEIEWVGFINISAFYMSSSLNWTQALPRRYDTLIEDTHMKLNNVLF